MPGVKLPEIPKHESQMPLSVGRTKLDMPDASHAMAQQTKDIEHVGEQLVQYEDKIEADAADTEATKRASDYEVSFRGKLYGDGKKGGAKFQEGDPTPVYQQFDSDMDEEYKRLTDVSDLSPRAAKLVNQRVTDRANQLQLTRLSEYGAQSAKYEHNVHTADVELKKQALPDASTYIDPAKPETFAPYDDIYAGIRNSHVRYALKSGSAVRDERGDVMYYDDTTGESYKVMMSPQAKIDMNKDLSEGVSNSMKVLINSGQVNKANALNQRYGQSLDPVAKANLADNFEKANIEQNGYALMLHPNKKKEILTGKDEVTAAKIEDKARSLTNTRQAEVEQAQNRVDKRNADKAGVLVQDRMRGEQPYVSVEAAMQDPEFKEYHDRIKDPKTRQALYHAIERPAKSNPAVLDRVQALVMGDDPNKDIRKMSYVDIQKELSGLDEQDSTRFETLINKQKTQTGEDDRVKMNVAGTSLKAEYMRLNNLSEYDFRSSAEHMSNFTKLKGELIDVVDRRGPMTSVEINKTVREFAVAAQEKRVYAAEAPNKFQGDFKKPVQGKTVATNKPFYEMGTGAPTEPARDTQAEPTSARSAAPVQKSRREWNIEYQRTYRSTATPQQLDTFIKSNGG